MTPDDNLIEFNNRVIKEKIEETQKIISEIEKNQEDLSAGQRQSIELEAEAKISSLLTQTRDQIGSYLLKTLPKYNTANIMALCGAKGSAINIC